MNEDFEDSHLIDGEISFAKFDEVDQREEEGQELVNHLDRRSESEMRKEDEEEEISRLIGLKKGAMEEITFELNGKRETFYVARQVDATLDDLPVEEDESFYSKVSSR